MREDLTAAFLAEMVKDETTPIQLVVFHFDDGNSPFYASDRDVVISSKVYDGIVENWGDLSTVGAENAVSSTMEMNITLWAKDLSVSLISEDPIDVRVDVFQTYAGLDEADFAHIGEFTIQDPLEFSEASNLVNLTLVTTNMRYFAQVGTLLTRQTFPNALDADVNKPISLIVGDAGQVKTLCSNKPAFATLSGSFLEIPTTINTQESPVSQGFTATGYIQIDEEIMYYSSITEDSIVVSQRGIGDTNATDHSDGSEIIQTGYGAVQVRTDYIVGQGPLERISEIKVRGQVPTVGYDIDLGSITSPAMIRFHNQPTYAEYSRSARAVEEYFDETEDNLNDCEHPEWAWNQENAAAGAIMGHSNPVLAVKQTSAHLDDGQLIKVFLVVDHWATKSYKNDKINVVVDGVIGELNRPNEKDIDEIGGVIDIRHGHEHEIEPNGGHKHGNTDVATKLRDNVEHEHYTSAEQTVESLGEPFSDAFGSSNSGGGEGYTTFNFDREQDMPSCREYTVSLAYEVTGSVLMNTVRLLVYSRLTIGGDWTHRETKYVGNATSGTISINRDGWDHGYDYGYDFKIVFKFSNASGAFSATLTDPKIVYQARVKLNNSNVGDSSGDETGDVIDITSPGSIDREKVKDNDDVRDLDDPDVAEIPLKDLLEENSSRTIQQRFDLTATLPSASWNTLKDKVVMLQYVPLDGANPEDAEIIITNIKLVVEYRQRQVRTTDEISCNAVGTIENSPDAVIQFLLTEKAGMDIGKLGSVNRPEGVWDDNDVWDDNQVWIDAGATGAPVPGAAFEDASAWFNHNNYRIDGVIPGNISVKDAIANITFQTRSKMTWQNGKAKLSILRESVDWLPAKDIDVDNIQLKSYQSSRSKIEDVVNKIDLFHTIDRLDIAEGSGQYTGTSSLDDPASIAKHGEKVDDDKWLFDLVRDQSMADDICEYYIWALGEPSTYYTFRTYLNNFDLEKEDYARISSYNFQMVNKLPVAIKELVREFGSGKISKINTLKLVCQVIRHTLLDKRITCPVFIRDSISVIIGLIFDLSDNVNATDALQVDIGAVPQDAVTVSDVLVTLSQFKPQMVDSVTVGCESAFSMSFELDDSILVTDNIHASEERCYGSCGYGGPECEIFYGSRTRHFGTMFDTPNVKDEIQVTLTEG